MQNDMSTLAVIIPAGGSGSRMRHEGPKLLIPLEGISVIERTIRCFTVLPLLQLIIPVSDAIRRDVEKICSKISASFPIRIVPGGAQRQDSVWNALQELDNRAESVAVHDAARPFFDPALLANALSMLKDHDGAVAALPATHTMKEVENGLIRRTIPRETLWQINTPQVFRREALLEAYKTAYEDNFYGTDDAMLMERRGALLCVVPDSYENIKITTAADLLTAAVILRSHKE